MLEIVPAPLFLAVNTRIWLTQVDMVEDIEEVSTEQSSPLVSPVLN